MEEKLVYHYTSLNTLQILINGMLKSKDEAKNFEFWATSPFFMNDKMELINGFDMLMSILPSVENKYIIDDSLKLSKILDQTQVIGKTQDDVKKLLKDNSFNMDFAPYVMSMSFNPCSVPMWYMYGNRGEGVCLGFNMNIKQHDDFLKMPVSYDFNKFEEDYKQIIVQAVETEYNYYLGRINELSRQSFKTIWDEKMSSIRVMCTLLAPFFKNEAFAFEEEFRLMKNCNNSEIRYRQNEAGLSSPYTIIKIPLKSLKKVIIGPCANYEQIYDVIHAELKYCDPQHFVEIEQSKVPLRKI